MRRTSASAVLAATQESLLAVGVRRTTFAEVGRRAGLSRATLYTHFPDVEAAIAAVLTRELGALLTAALVDVGDPTPAVAVGGPGGRARLVAAVTRVLVDLPQRPLFRTAVEVDADLLLPYVIQRLGGVQRLALERLEGLIAEGQRDGSIRDGDPTALATTVLLAVQSVLLASGIAEVAGRRAAVHAAVADLLDRGLRP